MLTSITIIMLCWYTCSLPGLLLNVAFRESVMFLGDTRSIKMKLRGYRYLPLNQIAFKCQVTFGNFLFEIPKSGQANAAGDEIKKHGSSKNLHIAKAEEPSSKWNGNK